MSLQTEKKQEVAPAQQSKLDSKTQKKLISLVLCFVAFAVMYLALVSDSETFMWGSLLFTLGCMGVLYLRN